ncbi:PP2C family serine/threonine-protein phosphatase [Streptomyces sp. CA-243310]|uniref:PP2C family serine/threonine-protein phosphatase n=1 Tax=Streptomyces sp. CA-243310 TaxID=3240056 RepID=UPI003D93622B
MAWTRPGRPNWICWAGDCRAYGVDPQTGVPTACTSDRTTATCLVSKRVDPQAAAPFASRIRTSPADATPRAMDQLYVPAGHLVILTSDGVHDQVAADARESLVREHQHDPRALVVSLVAAAAPDEEGYHDDATAVVLAPA